MAAGLLICTTLAALALPIRADAQFIGKASATGQFESNSNVFNLESGSGFRPSDTYYAYGADFNGNDSWGREQIYATASTKEYDYQHLTYLNHNEYSVDAGLRWQLAERLEGNLEVARTHSMVPFLDLTGTTQALSLLTVQTETFQIGLKLSSNWKLEGTAYTSKSTQPTPGVLNQQLTQTSGTTSLEYLGIAPLTSGLTLSYLSGDYSGSNGALTSSYGQSTEGFFANYKLKRTSFEGQVTYTDRTSDIGRDDASGLTGLIQFKDQLTPKTSFGVKIDRVINTYYLNLGSEVDTDAGVDVNWQARYKLAVSLGYAFTYRALPGQAQGAGGGYPIDHQQSAILGINYQPVRWLVIGPYARVLTRRSNTFGRDFDSTVYGVTVAASVGDDRAK